MFVGEGNIANYRKIERFSYIIKDNKNLGEVKTYEQITSLDHSHSTDTHTSLAQRQHAKVASGDTECGKHS